MNLLARFLRRARSEGGHSDAPHLALGKHGEQLAAQFLRKCGYKLLVRRFKGRHGEIDLVCRHNGTLVFVEVKTRTSEEFGEPSAAVDADKQRNLSRTALEYLRHIGNPDIPIRFDIVEVVMADRRRAAEIRVIENAFLLSGGYRF